MLPVTTTRTNPFPARFVSTEPRRRYRGPRRQVSGQIAVSYLNHGPKQWLIPGHAFNPASESIGPLSRIADLPFRVRLVTCSREPHSRAIYIYVYVYVYVHIHWKILDLSSYATVILGGAANRPTQRGFLIFRPLFLAYFPGFKSKVLAGHPSPLR